MLALPTVALQLAMLAIDVTGILCIARILGQRKGWRWATGLDTLGRPITDFVEERADEVALRLDQQLSPKARPYGAFILLLVTRNTLTALFYLIT
jgi:hypothetical protein